jgi:hypothetical protein
MKHRIFVKGNLEFVEFDIAIHLAFNHCRFNAIKPEVLLINPNTFNLLKRKVENEIGTNIESFQSYQFRGLRIIKSEDIDSESIEIF